MADEIAELCTQIDRRLGNRPGTTERGCYFHYWPPGQLSTAVLAVLHADAVDFLHTLTAATERTQP